MATAEETVELAIEHLDQAAPEDWRSRVDLERLNLESIFDCVLAQIWPGYMSGINRLSEHDAQWWGRYDDNVYADNTQYLDEWKRQLS